MTIRTVFSASLSFAMLLAFAVCSGEGGGDTTSSDEDADGFTVPDDCDDSNPDIYPGATEIPYDGVDQDCDGMDLWDADGDGYAGEAAGGRDCDDEDPDINPDADDVPYDGEDQDCDGEDLVDADGDGYVAEVAGGDDCDDEDPQVHPGAIEVPYDRTDQDCDGEDVTDQDGDGYDARAAGGEDCNDRDPAIHPGADEVCDEIEIDHDCDGETAINESICFLYPTDGTWTDAADKIQFTVSSNGTQVQMTKATYGSCTDSETGCTIAGGTVTETVTGDIFNSYGQASFFLYSETGNCWGTFDSVSTARGTCVAYSESCYCDAGYEWEAALAQ